MVTGGRGVLRGIGRIVWVAVAFVLAVASGLVVLALVGLERITAALNGRPDSPSGLDQWVDLANLVYGLTLWGAALSIVPALLAIVIGELARIRSLVYWVGAGGLAAVAAPVANELATSADVILPAVAILQLMATAGFAAGVVYWTLAGRSS
jgi:hypothetical protein